MQLEEIFEYIAQIEDTDLETVILNYRFGIYDDLIKELLRNQHEEC